MNQIIIHRGWIWNCLCHFYYQTIFLDSYYKYSLSYGHNMVPAHNSHTVIQNFITHSQTHKNIFIQNLTIMVVTQCGGGCGGARVSHDMSWYNKIKYSLSFAWVPSQKMCFVTFEYHIYTSCWYISCSRLFFASLISYSKFWLLCTLSFVST